MDRLSHIAWYEVIPENLGLLVREVLNHRYIGHLVYKSISIPEMLWKLGKVDKNCLILGKDRCWLVVARTCHHNYFLGTERVVSQTSKGYNNTRWYRVQDLLLRHATPGATVDIHLLTPDVPKIKPVAVVKKAKASQYQPPGCS